MNFADVIRLAGKYTLARMMEREDFRTRWEENKSISLHELLYPLAQAYDSVALECDVELGFLTALGQLASGFLQIFLGLLNLITGARPLLVVGILLTLLWPVV